MSNGLAYHEANRSIDQCRKTYSNRDIASIERIFYSSAKEQPPTLLVKQFVFYANVLRIGLQNKQLAGSHPIKVCIQSDCDARKQATVSIRSSQIEL